jgi:hypothetical protein
MKRISAPELLFFAEAWLLLAIARLILLFIPFRKIAPLLGRNIIIQQPLLLSKNGASLQQRIRTAISRAHKRSPWRTACFEQAIAAKIMLRSRKTISIVYFGVQKKEDAANSILAHAWLERGGIMVTGGKKIAPFSLIACFKS